MKTLVALLALNVLCLTACKKESNPVTKQPTSPPVTKLDTAGGFQIQVSGLTAKTAVNLIVTDDQNLILNIKNGYGDTTYTTSAVKIGDPIIVSYSTNIADDLAGDGDGTIKFFYKGFTLGVVGGILTGRVNFDIHGQ
jgi:hypothetical protein